MRNMAIGSQRMPSPVAEDGVFGPVTARATRRFERDFGEGTPDGVVTTADRIRWLGSFLASGWQGDPPLVYGDRDPRVGHLQVALNVWLARTGSPSPPLWIDTVFGPRTRAAVRRFQSSAGLAADGIVGARTWSALGVEGVLRFPPKDFR
jgi:peptidoglycan hydrolase-like protein with peptidoglycan-binding domain